MCLRFVFLLISRVITWRRLSRREGAWKTAEILILRHQVGVLQWQQPGRLTLNWADRALLACGVIAAADLGDEARPQRTELARQIIDRAHCVLAACRMPGSGDASSRPTHCACATLST